MTRIKYKAKPVWHATQYMDRWEQRLMLVAEQPSAILLRLKGTRTALELPYGIAYQYAAKLLADKQRAEKQAKRKARRDTKRGLIGRIA